jgi:hypothetical protein
VVLHKLAAQNIKTLEITVQNLKDARRSSAADDVCSRVKMLFSKDLVRKTCFIYFIFILVNLGNDMYIKYLNIIGSLPFFQNFSAHQVPIKKRCPFMKHIGTIS